MYKALYRKYRSRTFDEMCGQEAVVASLKNQIKNNEISHAYIFSGTRGTGKTSAAKIFSRAVNCLNPKDGNPCNECENCKAILNETVLDVVEMDAASNNGVDDIRELKEKVVYPPASLKYKVYIIDEVHMLSKGAFNALLKILEEPPRHLIFILATTELEKIPATILSRSQKFLFKRISTDVIEKHLKRISELEGYTCDDEVYSIIANSSDGAMRDALSVLDQLLSIDKKHIETKDAMEILGISSSDLLFELSEALIKRDINKSLDKIDEIFKEGVDFNTLTSQIINNFRDLVIVKTLKKPEKMIYSTHLEALSTIVTMTSLEDLLLITDYLKEISNEIKYADNKRIIFEMNAIKICNRYDNALLLKRVERLENKINNIGEISTNNSSYDSLNRNDRFTYNENNIKENINVKEINKDEILEKSNIIEDTREIEKSEQSDIIKDDLNENLSNDKELNLNQIIQDFPKIMDELKSKNQNPFAGVLKDATLTNYSNNTLEISFNENLGFHYNFCNNDEKKKILSDLLKSIYGIDIDIKVNFLKSHDKLEEIFGKENIIDI